MNFEDQKRDMELNLYMCAGHLYEAGKYMSDVDKNLALKFFRTAEHMLRICDDVPQQKVTQEKMDDIMNEIFGVVL